MRRPRAPGCRGGIPIYLPPSATRMPREMNVVTIDLKDVKLKTALRLLLGQLGLGYTVKDGLLIVEKAGSPELQGGVEPAERVRRGGFQ